MEIEVCNYKKIIENLKQEIKDLKFACEYWHNKVKNESIIK